ncbi:hypothetical protein BKK48_08980 [Rodentibacter heidelbergensis]|uniref:ShlB/FhaC/HecB family hemolysin secretion/activation protein n=1 Tax=Rodentibacter heidelbergensis TaxID=1908258 RepID=A0A1V3I7L2_9PAST|nr:hypothetical protein BKK48_08980 [Rodentibacter heidelbergensis]
MKPAFSFLVLNTLFLFPSFVQAVQNRPPTETEKQIISRQQQQQTALNSEIQSQQVQSPNVRFEAEKNENPWLSSARGTMFSHSSIGIDGF